MTIYGKVRDTAGGKERLLLECPKCEAQRRFSVENESKEGTVTCYSCGTELTWEKVESNPMEESL